MDKPRIFLGSSGKQKKLLQALTRHLEDVAHVDPWTTSFHPGTTTLARLVSLVPRQISTGDRTILGRISKRGNSYLRMLFVQAARASPTGPSVGVTKTRGSNPSSVGLGLSP